MSYSNSANGNTTGSISRNAWKTAVVANGLATSIHAPENITIPNSRVGGDGGSPTLPNLATQPTLNSLITSSLSTDVIPGSNDGTSASEPSSALPSGAVSSAEEASPTSPPSAIPSEGHHAPAPPRVGDSAKRMVGAALGLKHPGIAARRSLDPNEILQKAMGGLVIAE